MKACIESMCIEKNIYMVKIFVKENRTHLMTYDRTLIREYR